MKLINSIAAASLLILAATSCGIIGSVFANTMLARSNQAEMILPGQNFSVSRSKTPEMIFQCPATFVRRDRLAVRIREGCFPWR